MPLNFNVNAQDTFGNVATSYSGTVHFTSSDAQATLPANGPLSGGTGSFTATFKTVGSQTLTATDTATASLGGTSGSINVVTNAATHFGVSGSSTANTRTAYDFTVNALDGANNPSAGYSGTVHFTSTDAQAKLPANSALTSGTANFSATWETAGAQTITATDTATASITGSDPITVSAPPALAISSNAPPAGVVGNRYAPREFNVCSYWVFNICERWRTVYSSGYVLAATGGVPPYTWSWAAASGSSLPPGLTVLNTPNTSCFVQVRYAFGSKSTACIFGTPTKTGTYNVVLTAADSGSPSAQISANGTVTINLPPPPTVNGGPPVSPVVDVPYSYTFSATGNSAQQPFTWSESGTLPAGMAFSNSTGTLSGTATQTGSFPISVTATDQFQQSSAAANFTIVVTEPTINTTPPPPPGVKNAPYSFTFTAVVAQPATWSESGALPTGLTFSNSTGTLSGTPTQTGSFPITVTVTDPSKQSSAPADFTIVINAHGFLATGSMATARRFHTATLLGNGKVLIAGGEDELSNPFASAELYDPATGTFSATGNMTVPRVAHTATLLSNGKVLIAGGASDSSLSAVSSAELYDPASGTFTATTGNMTAARAVHTATLLQNGTVLLAGGDVIFFNGVQNSNIQSLASAEIFDPATGTFTATSGSMTAARENHTATLLSDGKVLITGGSDGAVGNDSPSASVYASAEVFDPSTGRFTAAGMMTSARDFHTASLLSNGKVLIAGGIANTATFLSTAELFDPASASFAATGSMTANRFYQDASVLNDGTVLLSGGSAADRALATAEVYDPVAGTFASTGSMLYQRVWHTSTVLQNGKVLVTGGAGNDSVPIATAEVYQ
jgi:hypothetical protein